jgi:GH18 family chitinase
MIRSPLLFCARCSTQRLTIVARDVLSELKRSSTVAVFTVVSPVSIAPHDEQPSKMLRVCYVTNWSRYRSGEAKFEIEFIDPFMCSHIIYAYATVDERRPEIIPVQKDDLGSTKSIRLPCA